MKWKNMTENQRKAEDWWSELSLNEMKALAKKYFPVFDLSYVNQVTSCIEEIYDKEIKNEQTS